MIEGTKSLCTLEPNLFYDKSMPFTLVDIWIISEFIH